MKMTFDHILIKELHEKGSVLLPTRAQQYPEKGEVVAVGEGDGYGYSEFMKTTVKPGDKVYFVKDRAYEVKLGKDKEKFYVLKERDILLILEKKDV